MRTKTNYIQAKVSPAEYAAVQHIADVSGLTVSEVIRRAVLSIDIKPRTPIADTQMLASLSAMGRLLKNRRPEGYQSVVEEINQTVRLLKDKLNKE